MAIEAGRYDFSTGKQIAICSGASVRSDTFIFRLSIKVASNARLGFGGLRKRGKSENGDCRGGTISADPRESGFHQQVEAHHALAFCFGLHLAHLRFQERSCC